MQSNEIVLRLEQGTQAIRRAANLLIDGLVRVDRVRGRDAVWSGQSEGCLV